MSEAREVIAREIYTIRELEDNDLPPFDTLTWEADYKAFAHEQADFIIAALNDAGLVVVERERFERLQDEAAEMQAEYAERGWGRSCLQLGDLDPLPEIKQ